MKRIATLCIAFGLAAAGSAALAAQPEQAAKPPKPQPVQMTEAQLDNVAAGALINAVLVDVVDVNNNNVQVAIPVNAAVAVQVLGGTLANAALQQPGRQVAIQ